MPIQRFGCFMKSECIAVSGRDIIDMDMDSATVYSGTKANAMLNVDNECAVRACPEGGLNSPPLWIFDSLNRSLPYPVLPVPSSILFLLFEIAQAHLHEELLVANSL